MGMESSSIYFAENAYKRTDDIGYIAYATEVAILDDNDGKIIKCGEKFIKDNGFDAYCCAKDEEMAIETSYKQYVYAQVCVAMYENGKKDEALARAFEWIGNTFPRNNAVVALLIAANKAQDNASVDMIKGKMKALQQNGLDDASQAYVGEILARLEK